MADLPFREVIRKVRRRVLPNLRYLPASRFRVCGACQARTLILAFGQDEEFHICIRCRANLRYELLARYLRQSYPHVERLDILELDDRSPLRGYFAGARSYVRSSYRDEIPPGTVLADGVVCEDITHLTRQDASLDLIVSSDVLEHVPDVAAAFRETARVLRRGGAHVFTVPPREITRQRARLESGRIVHLQDPEYHFDPLSSSGILTFWDFGPDFPERFAVAGLSIRAAFGPEGSSGRIVWEARKV